MLGHHKNDPNRKEEETKNIEFGTLFEYGVFYGQITFFNTKIEDVVFKDSTLTNVGELVSKGLTGHLGINWDSLAARLSYSQSRPELNGVPLSDQNWSLGTTVGDRWVLTLDYDATESVRLGWTSTLVERMTQVSDPTKYPEKPGYGVHDLYALWQPIQGEDLKLTLSVKNLFDRYYFDHASYNYFIGSKVAQGNANAGRDFRFNVSYAF